jgi:glycosyltransferase involved in cell wall biosynthesis
MAQGVEKCEGRGRPSFAVVLCINRENLWVDDAIRSVLQQTDPDFEFLIAANACTDALWERLQKISLTDKRVRLIRSAIGQLPFNLNLLANSTGSDYLVRMDADDVSEPDRLRILREALRQDPVDVMGSAVTLIDGAGCPIGRMDLPNTDAAIKRALPLRTIFCHPAVAVRRQFLLEMRGYLGGFASEDTDLWLRAVRVGAKMRNLPDLLLRYRIHENQSSLSCLGYAEVAGHWLRELLINRTFYTFRGFTCALAKALFAPLLLSVRRGKSASYQKQT